MKKLSDIINLLLEQSELNEKYRTQFVWDYNSKYNWLSFSHEIGKDKAGKDYKEVYLNNFKLDSEAKIQEAYWVIYNNRRKVD